MGELRDLIYSKQTIEFVAVANEYCTLVENTSQQLRKDFIQNAQSLLSLLYLKALTLQEPQNISEEGTEKFVSEEDWLFVKATVSEKLGEKEIFSELYEPLNQEEAVSVSLSECFADIYQDCKDFVQLYEFANLEAINEGLWECLQNFQHIWGPRLLFILKEMHNMLYGNYDMEETKKEDSVENAEQKQSRTWLNENFFK